MIKVAVGPLARLRLRFAFFLSIVALALPSALHADDVSATSRGVVRIIVFVFQDNQLVDVSQGSGFAVAPDKVVTNAHVVNQTDGGLRTVVVGVVPSEGDRPSVANVLKVDSFRDLALLEAPGKRFVPATILNGNVASGAHVVALGYPGNVELAAMRSVDDFIAPQPPTRSEGNFSSTRQIDGIQALLHTAAIGHGSSGGPLVDPCGRVIGVNTFVTKAENGDAPFGFAITASALASFLQEAGEKVSIVTTPCVTMAEREAAAKRQEEANAQQERARQAAAAEEQRHKEASLREQREEHRQKQLALTIALSILGIAALGAAGILLSRDKNKPALAASAVGAFLVIGGVGVFWFPTSGTNAAEASAMSPPATAPAAKFGRFLCSIDEVRSRVVRGFEHEVALSWKQDGCVNGRTQYAKVGGGFRRALVPHGSQTVSVVDINPVGAHYQVSRYELSAADMERARDAAKNALKACSSTPADDYRVEREQQAIAAVLPAQPDEKLVYSCVQKGD